MRQAVIRSPSSFAVETVSVPELRADDELLIRTAVSGICSGDLMEWYLKRKVGTVLGHEVVGWAERVGREISGIKRGDLVFTHHHAPCGACRHCRAGDEVHCRQWRESKLDPGGMAEYIRVPGVNAQRDTFAVNDLRPEAAVFIEPLACSVKAFWRLPAGPRDVGVIVGCGVMGLLNVAVAKATGTKVVWAVDPVAQRREFARACGADEAFAPDDLVEELRTGRRDAADYVMVGPGHPDVLRGATSYVRSGATLVQFTPTPEGVLTGLDLGELYFREIRWVPSYSCGPRETREAYRLLREELVRVDHLVTHRFPLERIQEAYDTAKRGGAALKVLVTFAEDRS